MKGAPGPLGGDGLAVMANTAEPERAGRGQDRQEGPVLGRRKRVGEGKYCW